MFSRRILVAAVGWIQVLTGIIAVALVYILYQNFFDAQSVLQTILNIPLEESLPLYLLLLLIFGLFWILSGFSLIQEWREGIS
jgi:hypothetical protein